LTGVTTGTLVYDSTLGLLQAWNGSSWVAPQAVQSTPTASAVRTSSTTTSSGAAITYQSAGWDTNGIWSAASPTRLTAQIAGLYYVYFQVQFSTTATGNMAVRIYAENISAPTTNTIQNTVAITGGTMVGNVSTVFPMQVGDYITSNLGFNTGTTTIDGNSSIYSSGQTRMGMFYIGKIF
jgi:predicted phage tail protein